MKLVVTDGATLSGGGVSLDGFRRFGELVVYDLTAPEQLAERVGDADAVLCNKTPIPAELFDQCPNLRYVGECATGYNNIDIAREGARRDRLQRRRLFHRCGGTAYLCPDPPPLQPGGGI